MKERQANRKETAEAEKNKRIKEGENKTNTIVL